MKNRCASVSRRIGVLEVLRTRRFGVPLCTLMVGAILLWSLLTDSEIDFSEQQSPGLWPRAMITGLMIVAVMALLLAIYDSWRARVLRRQSADQPSSQSAGRAAHNKSITDNEAEIIAGSADAADLHHDGRRAILGIAGIVGYAAAVQVMGFLLATLAIIAYWMAIWGVRSISRIALTSVLGTMSVLVVFLKIGYLPLPKGMGIFDDVTVYLYRIFHLF